MKTALLQHLDYLYNIAYRVTGNADDAQDAVQESFLKAFRNWDRYDPNRDLKNWLTAITVNTCKDIFRKKQRFSGMDSVSPTHLSDKGASQASLENGLLGEKLLNTLPFEYRTVMVLFYMEEKTIKEIAKILKIPLVLVKVRLHRARKKLMGLLI